MLPLQIVSVIIVLKSSTKYLLVKRSIKDSIFPGKWQNMGGKVELGEKVEEAIKREVREEVGLTVGKTPIFLKSYSWKKDKNDPFRLGLIFLIYLEKNFSDYKIKLDKELSDFMWLEPEEIAKMNEKDLLIGKDSPTGTFQQILEAERVINNFTV